MSCSRPSLYRHQRESADMWKHFKRFCLWLDAGVGKTATALTVLREVAPFPALVMCPLTIVESAWIKDARTFAPELRIAKATGSPKKRAAALLAIEDGAADVAIANYEAVRASSAEFMSVRWRTVVLDESTRLMNPRSKTARLCHALCHAPGVEYVTAMSACPTPNSPLEIWSQVHAVKEDHLGPSFWSFRAGMAYQPSPRAMPWKWVIRPGEEERLVDRVGEVSRFLRKEECLDLPETTHETIEVPLSSAERRAYDTFLREWIVHLDEGEVVGQTALAELMKLRQFTAGLARTRQGEWAEIGDSKLRALRELVQDIGKDPHGREKSFVVVGQFRREVERAADTLRDMGLSCGIIYGGTPAGERADLVERFQGGELRALVVHPLSAGHGLTLTAAADMIFLSHGYSWEQEYQVRQRIHRIGQRRPCTYYHLVSPGTIDEDVAGVLEKKQSADVEFVRRFRERV